MPRNWYLAQCKTSSHFKAKRNLTQQGFEVFLPLEEIFVQKERVWVLINLMGQKSRLQITHDKIQMAR